MAGESENNGGGRKLAHTEIGYVTSDRRQKTRTVKVRYLTRHPKYGKILHRNTNYHVHDPAESAREGDRVEIARCRPISKSKSWRLVRVIERAAQGRRAGTAEGA